jgi:hypothetical protein
LEFFFVGFPFFAKAYRGILDACLSYTKGLEALFYNAHNDFTWQTTVLLAPLITTDDGETVRRKIAVTATYLDIWLMRRVVNYIRVGYSSVNYAMYLLCRDIRRKHLNELVDILYMKLSEDEADVSFRGSPSRGRGGIAELALNQFSRRYIFHFLARITAFTEAGSGRSVIFDQLIDRNVNNPFDIEHIWANNFARYSHIFQSEQKFYDWRDHIAALLLLPADVNRSLQDMAYPDKTPHYAKQNFYAASLAASAYEHQPQFEAFRTKYSLPFKPFSTFGKAEQLERQALIEALADQVWSPERLKEAAL